jgi:hypothetical protein
MISARQVLPVTRSKQDKPRKESLKRARWLGRAKLCPHAPEVSVLAAYYELMHARGMPPYSADVEAFEALAEELRDAHEHARLLLEAAREESQRRGRPSPPMLHYLLAHIALSSGDLVTADAELSLAWRGGMVALGELELLAAVLELVRGDTERAIEYAHRVYVSAQGSPSRSSSGALWRSSSFLLALAYERAGAPEVARRLIKSLRAHRLGEGGSEIEVLLPLHERLYLTALEHRVAGNAADAIRFWEVYLDRAEPAAPEREAATRQLAELRSGRGL